jgi:AcrR family transcriptional regulator
MTDKSEDADEPVIAAALRLAAERGWHKVSLRDIAEGSGLGDAELRRRYACKMAVLLSHAQAIERQAAALEPPFDAEDSPRDRLFELLMQRIDLLKPHQAAIAAILRDLPRDPVGVIAAAPEIMRLMAGILEAAGLPARGPFGLLRGKGLALIWFATLRVWATDESPDHARTMAALDGYLRRVEPWAGRFPDAAPFGRRGTEDAAP